MLQVLLVPAAIAGCEDVVQPVVIGLLWSFSVPSWGGVWLVSGPGSLALLVVGDSMIVLPLGSSSMEAIKWVGLGGGAFIEAGSVFIELGGAFFRGALMTFAITS